MTTAAPLFVGLTHHTVHLLERAGAHVLLLENATPDAIRGRAVVIAPSAARPGQEKHAERQLRAMGAAKIATVTPEVLRQSGALDVADFLETRNGHAVNLDELAGRAQPLKASTGPSAPEGNSAGWPEPLPLREGLPVVDPFDFALLPETLQPWARDICERVQCPPDYVGVTIMAALGSVIGRKVGIRPQAQTDWTEFPNQWAMVVGRPGVLKSPAMEAALSPLKRLASRAAEAHRAGMEEYAQTARLAKLRAEASEKAARAKLAKNLSADIAGDLARDETEAPILKRYMTSDTSVEALGELLRHNPNGLLVHRDEIVSLLKGLDCEENASARGFYLTGWNGNSAYTFDRIGRGLNLHVEAVCLSLLGSTQPGRIAEYLRAAVKGGAGVDGLIQRFGLLVWPDIPATSEHREAVERTGSPTFSRGTLLAHSGHTSGSKQQHSTARHPLISPMKRCC